MFVFIATIFIAELIITGFLVSIITKADRKINCICEAASKNNKEIIQTVKELHRVVKQAKDTIHNTKAFVIFKKQEIRSKIINLVLIYLCIIALKTKLKKTAKMLQYILLARDFWMSIPV